MNVDPRQSSPAISCGSNSLNHRARYQQGIEIVCRLITYIGCFMCLFSALSLQGEEQVVKENLDGDKWYQAFITSNILYKGQTALQNMIKPGQTRLKLTGNQPLVESYHAFGFNFLALRLHAALSPAKYCDSTRKNTPSPSFMYSNEA